MPDYTVKDSQTGKTITFRWNGAQPPTDADMADVFAAAKDQPPKTTAAPAEDWRRAVGKGQVIFSNKVLAGAVENAPMIGGAIGGVMGGVPGAVAGGAAGSLMKQGIQAASGQTTEPVTPLQAAGNVVGAGAAQGAMQAAGPLIGKVAERLAPALMQSALKPGIRTTLAAVKSGKIPPVVETLLKEGVNVTPAGIEKLNAVIGASNDAIKDALKTVPHLEVQPLKVASRLTDTARRFASQVNPEADLEAVSKAGQEFLERYGGEGITISKAQALKTGTYAQLKSKAFGELKGADIEAQKALARGLKEEIAAEIAGTPAGIRGALKLPGGIDVATANAREGAALEARDVVAKRVALAANRDPAGLAWLAHNPVTFLSFLATRSQAVKSMLARGLYQSAGAATKVSPQLIRAAVAAVVASGGDEGPREAPSVRVGPYTVREGVQ